MEIINKKHFKYIIYILLIITIIFLIGQLSYVTRPLNKIFSMILPPILLGGFLYYLLRPMVSHLSIHIHNKILAIIITLITTIIILGVLFYFGGNIITEQFKDLIEDITYFYNQQWSDIDKNIENGKGFYSVLQKYDIQEKLTSLVENIFVTVRNNIISFFSTITDLGTIIILIPFVLFYFLKDDKTIFHNLLNIVPENKKESTKKLLLKIDKTLSVYISGRLIVSILLGILTYIGFIIIDLPNAVILSFIIMLTSFIPIIGPIIGSLPAIFIAITTNLWLVLKVLIVILIVQILEGNVIQPGIQGGILRIHPLTVIFSILIFTILFGIIGALFAVPIYVIIRIVVNDVFIKKELSK